MGRGRLHLSTTSTSLKYYVDNNVVHVTCFYYTSSYPHVAHGKLSKSTKMSSIALNQQDFEVDIRSLIWPRVLKPQ